jgi:hypothetical protein
MTTTKIEKIINGYNTIEYTGKHIYIIENILNDELCENIRNVIDTVKLQTIDYSQSQNVKCHIINEEDILNLSDTMYYPLSTNEGKYLKLLDNIKNGDSIYTNNLNGIMKDPLSFDGKPSHDNNTFNKIMCKICNIETLIKSILKTLNDNIYLECNSGYIFRKIYGKTRMHADGPQSKSVKTALHFVTRFDDCGLNVVPIRTCSAIFCLNDDYEGGVFHFPNQDVHVRLKKGSVILFPPYWTHPHEVDEPTNNTYRYTLSTWFCKKIMN